MLPLHPLITLTLHFDSFMNTIFIVLPILTLLMFDLGLALRPADFRLLAERPKAVFVGLTGQILLLPLIAWAVASGFHLAPLFFLGVMLIACSPGGSSSNVFSMLAGGDVALSVSLTAFSSIITLFTGPECEEKCDLYKLLVCILPLDEYHSLHVCPYSLGEWKN